MEAFSFAVLSKVLYHFNGMPSNFLKSTKGIADIRYSFFWSYESNESNQSAKQKRYAIPQNGMQNQKRYAKPKKYCFEDKVKRTENWAF